MKTIKTSVLIPTGLHAGPARHFIQEAKKFPCLVKIRFRGREFDAKSMIGILGAGIAYGDMVEIVCTGEHEEDACSALAGFLCSTHGA